MTGDAPARAPGSRRGAALPAALVAVAVLGILAASLATGTRTAASGAAGAVAERRADDAATAAAWAALRDWSGRTHDTLSAGAAHAWIETVAGVGTRVRVTRLDRRTYSVDAEARVHPDGARLLARRAVRLLVAADPLLALPDAALTLRDSLDADPATEIVGADTIPPGWACDAADTLSVAAIARDAEPARYARPPPPAPPSFAAALPSDTLAALGARALPLVHVRGDHAVVGARRQGVLLVDGDLTLAAGAEVWGVVVVGGTLHAHGARVVGAVLAGGRTGAPHVARGLRVRWSSCVAGLALRAAGAVRPVTGRALTAGR